MSPAFAKNKKDREFDPNTFLATIGEAVPKKQTIFAQGDEADVVFYVQKGKVRLTVVSKTGKEATNCIVSESNCFGEAALASQVRRMGSAAAMTDCDLMRIDKKAMMSALHVERAFSDLFAGYLLARNIPYEEDLVDQLFYSSEKRLARVLLLLARFGKEGDGRSRGAKYQPGDAGRNGRYHSFASQLLHESVQEIGFHSLQRWATSPQLAA
jgi:CRP-like cAMP-binding protein